MATLKILYVYCKILGICPFNLAKDGHVRLSYCGVIYAVILTVAYVVLYIRAVTNAMTFVLPRQTPITQLANFTGLTFESGALILSWLYLGLRPQRLRKMLERFKNLNESFKTQGICSDDERFFKEIKIHLTAINVLWYLLSAYCCALIHNFEPLKLFVWMPLIIPRIVNHNVAFIFVDVIKSLGQRFRLLNEYILGLSDEVSSGINIRQKCTRDESKSGRIELSVNSGPLEACGQMYSNLIALTTIVVQFFSVSILMTIMFQCFQIASSFYSMCIIMTDNTLTKWTTAWVLWLAMHVIELVIIVHACDSTVREANRTGGVLHMMEITGRIDKYMDSVKVLSLRLLQQRLSVGLFGFFPLNLAIIYRIGSTITAYVTVMMQLDSLNYRG